MSIDMAAYQAAVETPLAELREHPYNPRRIEPARLAALKTSMQKDHSMLQVRPVIALMDGTVIMGNQRLRAAHELGWTSIPCIRVDLDEAQAKQWMLRDNNSYGEWDPSLLSEIIKNAETNTKEQLAELGFRPIDIRKLVPKAGGEAESPAFQPVYHLRIDCENETDQREMLEHLTEEGYDVHPLLAYAPRKRAKTPPPTIGDRAAEVHLTAAIERTPRVMQVEGLFDLTPEKQDAFTIRASLPLSEQPWNVGLIVGPSGSGKSTIARHLFPVEDPANQWDWDVIWSPTAAIVDAFPMDMSVSDLGELLSSVGFSSPRAWLRPFGTLSNGEQFRVRIALALAKGREVTVVDEFTSVVDRTVAQTASWAVGRAARTWGRRFVAITCHEDVADWLQPDWVYRPATDEFSWRSLQHHPPIEIIVRRCDASFWPLFRRFHYLNHNLMPGADSFVGFWNDVPVAFHAYTPAYGHPLHRIGSRAVCLPDYQGVGIGTRFADFTAAILTSIGLTVHSVSSHPARIAHNAASPNWKMTSQPALQRAQNPSNIAHMSRLATRSTDRITTSFQYVGPRMLRAKVRPIMDQLIHMEPDGSYSLVAAKGKA